MEKQESFIQVWDYLIDNDELDCADLILLSKIISLSTTKDGCYMSNTYIATLLRLKNKETASRRITRLKMLGYIKVDEKTKDNKSSRKIYNTYQNGLILKSSRVDSKVNTLLISKSLSIDSKVIGVLTPELHYNISNNINLKEQLDDISSRISDKNITGDERWELMQTKMKLELELKSK